MTTFSFDNTDSEKKVHVSLICEKCLEDRINTFSKRNVQIDRKIIFCTSWIELIELIKKPVSSISINADCLNLHSFVAISSMIETFSNLLGGENKITFSLEINQDTHYDTIKKAQQSNILGIVPSCGNFGIDEMLKALSAQWSNIPYWPEHILSALPGRVIKPKVNASKKIKLTNRQQQIFDLVTNRGCSNKHIANMLKISESTVKLHLGNIFKKYGVKNRTQLAVFSKE